MNPYFIELLGKLIKRLTRWYIQLTTGEEAQMSLTDISPVPVILSGSMVNCNVVSPRGMVVVEEKCRLTGSITAREVIVKGQYYGLVICDKLTVKGTCEVENSLVRSLEAMEASSVKGDITFEPGKLVVHRGAFFDAMLTPEENIDLIRFGIIVEQPENIPVPEPPPPSAQQAPETPAEPAVESSAEPPENFGLDDSEEGDDLTDEMMDLFGSPPKDKT